MKIEHLQARILNNQDWLIAISNAIKLTLSNRGKKISLSDWIIETVKDGGEILDAFDLQQDKSICKALLTLLRPGSSYRESLLKMLTYRVLSYIHATMFLRNYAKDNNSIDIIIENLKPLLELAQNYTTENLENLTIDSIHASLHTTGLKEYIAHFKETDIQIVLKGIKGDSLKEAKRAKLEDLLSFLFKRLKANLTNHKAIASSRHAWWALKDIIFHSRMESIEQNHEVVGKILTDLIERGIYFQKKQTQSNDILDTTNVYYERVWVLENAIQILVKMQSLQRIFTIEQNSQLRGFIQTQIELHGNSEARENNLRNVQADLIVLYFIIENYQQIYNAEDISEQQVQSNSRGPTLEQIINIINN